MSCEHGTELWESSAWRREALAWLDARLGEAGLVRTGNIDRAHVRPWATAMRVPTDSGHVWMKASGPATGFEVGLYELMHRVAPNHVLRPIATDTGRAWIILEDGGPVLTDQLEGEDFVDALEAALVRYAELQRLIAPHADALVSLGAMDMRPAMLPERFEQALGLVDGDDRARLEDLRPDVARWCEELATAPGLPTIDHNDLHGENVLLGPPPRVYDWGDSVVAHPFASMLVTLSRMGGNPEADDAPIARLRDAYLDGFSDLAPHGELLRTQELATRVALIAHAITCERVLTAVPAHEVSPEWAIMPRRVLMSLLEPS